MARTPKNWNFTGILAFVGVGLLFIILSPILVPLITFALLREWYREAKFRRFLKRNEGAKYFCYPSKETGVKFAREVLIPKLNPDVHIVYLSQRGLTVLDAESEMSARIGRTAGAGKRSNYPCVVKIVNGKIVARPVNREFYLAIEAGKGANDLLSQISEFFDSPERDPQASVVVKNGRS